MEAHAMMNVVTTSDGRTDRRTDRRAREEKRVKGSSSSHHPTASLKGKSAMSARRRIDFEERGEDYDSYDDMPIAKTSRTARMHTSDVFRLSKSSMKPRRSRHRVYYRRSGESRSPSPQPPPPSPPQKRRREYVRVARPQPKQRAYYVVSGSDTE